MVKRLTIEQFIKNAENIHQDEYGNPLYLYDQVIYINNKTNVKIWCIIHEFYFNQTPHQHVDSESGCVKCSGSEKKTTKKFIEESQEIHKNENGIPLYKYDKVDYKNTKTKVEIWCFIHQYYFKQTPDSHVNNENGCPKCGGCQKKTTEEFIKQSQIIHKDGNGNPLYLYHKVNYITCMLNVIIWCIKCQKFFNQAPNNHTSQKQGCRDCGIKKSSLSRTKTLEEFIKEAKEIHQDEKGNPLYNYSNIKYINCMEKVDIWCIFHQEKFKQTPNNHINKKQGCSRCAGKRKKTIEEFIDEAKEIHQDENGNPLYNYDRVIYKNNKTYVDIWCFSCKKFFLQKPNSHISGKHGCQSCCKHKTEKLVIKIVELIMNCDFNHNIRPKWLHGLELDCYNEKLQLAVEYNGIQHYKWTPHYQKTINDFYSQQGRDISKELMCQINNVNLIIIPYQYNFKDINKLYNYIFEKLVEKEYIFIM